MSSDEQKWEISTLNRATQEVCDDLRANLEEAIDEFKPNYILMDPKVASFFESTSGVVYRKPQVNSKIFRVVGTQSLGVPVFKIIGLSGLVLLCCIDGVITVEVKFDTTRFIRVNPSRESFFQSLLDLKILINLWLDGFGLAPSHDAIDQFVKKYASSYPDDIPYPSVYPTPNGGICLEWEISAWRISAEIDLLQDTAYWHALNLKTDECDDSDLELGKDWCWILESLREKTKLALED